MSKYGWERGTITLPAKDWAAFRKGLLTKWNEKQTQTFTLAQIAHTVCLLAAKGLRGENRQKVLKSTLAARCGGRIHYNDFEGNNYELYETLSRLIFKRDTWDGPVTLQKPQQKAMDLKPVSKDASVNCGEATVTFHNATKSVTWNVPENNHAVETAREHWFAKALFTALGNITWTRGNGGTIVGNDEYNRDSDYEDGGGNYVTAEYSMAAQKRAAKARGYHSSYNNYGGKRSWFW